MGKTHSRLALYARDGSLVRRLSRSNERPPAAPWQPLDSAANRDWLIASLADFADYPVEAIIPVAHGAAVAALREGTPAFAPIDYEWPIPDAVMADYRQGRDGFAVTGSPAFPGGLNMGSQLHYLDSKGHLEGVTLLPYAQYWAWMLSRVAASEVTSLGCHSDLWQPGARDFSPMARRRGWAGQFAPLVHAGSVIGTLRPDIARLTGLAETVRVHAGLHDSNAALLAARAFPEIAGQEATVLSTGTWFVAMRTPGEPVDLAALPEARDCLVNVDVDGQPVPSARFMGGREIELLGARIDVGRTAGLSEALASGAMVLPSLAPGCGPFPADRHRWIAEPQDSAVRGAAAALYAALMADAALDLIGAKARLLIEGRFAASELFTRALAALRPDMAVYTAAGEADASFGALRLVWPDLAPRGPLARAVPLAADLNTYRAKWRKQTNRQGEQAA